MATDRIGGPLAGTQPFEKFFCFLFCVCVRPCAGLTLLSRGPEKKNVHRVPQVSLRAASAPLYVRVSGILEGVAELLPQEVFFPMLCLCGFRSLVLAGGAVTPGHSGRLCRSASFLVT